MESVLKRRGAVGGRIASLPRPTLAQATARPRNPLHSSASHASMNSTRRITQLACRLSQYQQRLIAVSRSSSRVHNSKLPPAECKSAFSTRRAIMSAPKAAETDSQAAQTAEAMNVTPESLSKTLQEKIGATYCTIEDMSGGCGQAFEAIIVSPQFEKKTSLARHRLVNGALRQEIAAIHAWTPKCFTPEEWQKRQGA